MDYEVIKDEVLSKMQAGIINFGIPGEFSPQPDKLIIETEKQLGCKLPPSYIWYITTFGGGEIYGDAIYSIYGEINGALSTSDISYLAMSYRKSKFIEEYEIPICSSDFGEIFSLDTRQVDEAGEYPVYRKLGEKKEKYTDSFAEFLVKYANADTFTFGQ